MVTARPAIAAVKTTNEDGSGTDWAPSSPTSASAAVVEAMLPFLREHLPIIVVVSAGIVVRALVEVTYHPALMFVGDSYGYLLRAADLNPGVVRPILYPLFLAPWQHMGHVAAGPVLQHVLGVAVGIGLYALMRRLGGPGPHCAMEVSDSRHEAVEP